MLIKIRISIDSNVIIWFILTPYLNPTSQSLLPSPLKPKDYTPPNKSSLTHKVIRHLLHVYGKNIEWKLISLCLSSDYFLIAYLHIFVYELYCTYSLPFQSIVHILYLRYIYLGDYGDRIPDLGKYLVKTVH